MGRPRCCNGPWSLDCAHNADDAWVEQIYSVSNTEGGVELAPHGWCLVFAATGDGPDRSLSLEWSLVA